MPLSTNPRAAYRLVRNNLTRRAGACLTQPYAFTVANTYKTDKTLPSRTGAAQVHRYARGVAIMDLLLRVETHQVAVGLPGTRRYLCGPVTITVAADPEQPLAARLTGAATAADVAAAAGRMQALDVPERFEWIDELLPGQAGAFDAPGFVVRHHPLLVLAHVQAQAARPGVTVERVDPASPDDLAATTAAVSAIAFSYDGSSQRRADAAHVELAIALFSRGPELARTRALLADERVTVWLARLDGQPAATAHAIRYAGAVEIVGVGTVAASRGRGLATAVTESAAAAAVAEGADLVFLTAEDADSARLYQRLGFETVGTVCVAQRASSPSW